MKEKKKIFDFIDNLLQKTGKIGEYQKINLNYLDTILIQFKNN